MTYVTIRELRNHGGEVVDRAAAGETITITRNGRPVTLAELTASPLATTDPAEKATRRVRLERAAAGFESLAFDTAAASAYGAVADSMRRAGRKPAARAFDVLIAATALANKLPLYTCNPGDFQGIDGLTVTAITHPDQARP